MYSLLILMNYPLFICGLQKYIFFSSPQNLFSTFLSFFRKYILNSSILLNLYQTTGNKSNTFLLPTK
jgi:hypothetical protein